jgi:hypothetical protein
MLISEKYEIPEKNPISCLYIFTNTHGFYIAFSFYDWWSALKMLHRLHRTLFKASQWTRMKKNSQSNVNDLRNSIVKAKCSLHCWSQSKSMFDSVVVVVVAF